MILKEIKPFLEKNGFEMIEENHFVNDRCSITIQHHGDITEAYYAVANNNGDAMYSKNINIYWLIGVLIMFDYVDEIIK